MKFSVYLLYSPSFERTYVGQTSAVSNRVKLHNSGKVRSTKPYRPWVLVYVEEYETRAEAVERERWFKGHQGRGLIKKILAEWKGGGLSVTSRREARRTGSRSALGGTD